MPPRHFSKRNHIGGSTAFRPHQELPPPHRNPSSPTPNTSTNDTRVKMRDQRLVSWFITTSAVIWIVTGLAKLISSIGGHSRILSEIDPVFLITNRKLLLWAGLFELFLVAIILKTQCQQQKILSTCIGVVSILAYRVAAVWVNAPEPCPCFGTLFANLSIPQRAIDSISVMLLSYLIIGCGISLFTISRQGVVGVSRTSSTSA